MQKWLNAENNVKTKR